MSPSSSPSIPAKQRRGSFADDVTLVGGNLTGIFVSNVTPGSQAAQWGLKEGSELLEVCVCVYVYVCVCMCVCVCVSLCVFVCVFLATIK